MKGVSQIRQSIEINLHLFAYQNYNNFNKTMKTDINIIRMQNLFLTIVNVKKKLCMKTTTKRLALFSQKLSIDLYQFIDVKIWT